MYVKGKGREGDELGVYGYEDGFDVEGAGTVEELGCFLAVGIDVELEEEGLVGRA